MPTHHHRDRDDAHRPPPLSATTPSSTMRFPPSMSLPPAPTASDLPADKELLQRWANANGRSSAFQKRHASFDSPREVPLPSPSLPLPSPSLPLPSPSLPLPSPSLLPALFPSSGTTPSARLHNDYFSAQDAPPSTPDSASDPASPSHPVFEDADDEPASSATSASSPPRCTPPPESIDRRTTTIATPIFPFSRPYSLPSAQPSPPPSSSPPSVDPQPETHWTDRFSSASLPLPANVPFHTLLRAPADPDIAAGDAHAARVRQAHRSEVGSAPRHYPYAHAPPVPPSSSGSGSGSAGRGTPELGLDQREEQDYASSLRRRRSSESAPPLPHAHPPRPATSPQPTPSLSHRSASTSTSTNPSYPAPDPPTILAPTTSPGPFLSHAPPPPDSWIEVETSAAEYRLVVCLPGFRRDGITLTTKRRRVLHVVADKWEGAGGHFERRISFGYDADLVQVRAEFDGEMLRISIPRRLPPVDLWPTLRPGPIGRLG